MRFVTIALLGIVAAACSRPAVSPDMCRGVTATLENEIDLALRDPAGGSDDDKRRVNELKIMLPKLRQRYGEAGFSGKIYDAVGDMTPDQMIALAKTCLAQS